MSETVHLLIERYGLIAVFLGCLAEGESFAILAGFFAHQHVFAGWQAFATVFSGAFLGDVLFFLAGRRFADHRLVARLRERPGFAHAYRMVRTYPATYVLLNRFIYGFRLMGGVAAGLSGIAGPKFLALNALSALTWASLFGGMGYVFGLGAEQFLGSELERHERLIVAIAIGIVVAALAGYVAHRRRRQAAGE